MPLFEDRILTVSQLNELANAALAQHLVKVRGEVSDYRPSGKFVYFDIKDDASRAACFAMGFQINTPLENGMEVVVTGSPGLYVPYGKYTFRVKSVEPVGEGALAQEFARTKARLEAEGLFADARKKPLPRFPERIAVVTSRDAAAYTDFMRILKNRWPATLVTLYDVRVQGDGAEDDIAEAIASANAAGTLPDVIVLTRGGGSLEDLKAFNTERVVRAVASSRVPVVSGVGHERDVTLADFVADVRASTPSNAAERVVPDAAAVAMELASFRNALDGELARRLRAARERFSALAVRLERTLRAPAERLRMITTRLEAASAARLQRTRTALERLETLLNSLNPTAVLARGYAVVKNAETGRVLAHVADAPAGTRLTTLLADGTVTSRVEELSA